MRCRKVGPAKEGMDRLSWLCSCGLYTSTGHELNRPKILTPLEQAAKLILDEFADWYDGPGYFPSSFVAAIIRLRRALESK